MAARYSRRTTSLAHSAEEFITVGVRDPNATPPGGVLRRYALPDFKLKATYHLNMPAHRAAVDEKAGKLYLAMVSTPIDAKKPEREAAIVAGEIHVFDLKKLLDGSVAELEQVKLTGSLSVGSGMVSGLELSPSGDAVYAATVTTTGPKTRPLLRGKLFKFDTTTNRPTELTCDAPVWAMDMTTDGRRLAVLERTDPSGVSGGGNLVLIDTANWRRVKAVPLSGVPLDVTYLGVRTGVLERVNGATKLSVVEPDGELNQSPVEGDQMYVKATPDGTRLLASAGLPTNGLTLYTVDGGKPLKLDKRAASQDLAGTALGGLCAMSPDGKLGVFNTGVVIDLEKSGGK